jgi:hypothetical protein
MSQPAWVCRIIREIAASTYARIVLVIRNALPKADSDSAVQGISARLDALLYTLYRDADDRLFRETPDAFALADIGEWLCDPPVLTVTPVQRESSYDLAPQDLVAVRQFDLDVVLRFGFRVLSGESVRMARHGVWSYYHGDDRVHRGGPEGFWEVMEGRSTTASILKKLTGDFDNGDVLYRSSSQTDQISVRRSRNNYLWKSSAFMLRKLQQLWEEGPSALTPEPAERESRAHSATVRVTPGNASMAKNLVRLGGRAVRNRVERTISFRQWFVAYTLNGSGAGIQASAPGFRVMTPPRDRCWADPFPLFKDGRYYIFIEELVFKRGKGWISVVELDENGDWSPPRRILETPYHLSYPFLFWHDGELYLMPESAENQTIEVYRCRSFPYEWELAAVPMQGILATDATLHHDGTRWWMFTNLAEPGASLSDELHLFYAHSPLGPWTPHRRNPVKSDVRSARSAGRLFHRHGRLHRPAQDCSKRYGYAVSINVVEHLDEHHYAEREVSRIDPDWMPGIVCTHTFNVDHDLTVLDARQRRWRFP